MKHAVLDTLVVEITGDNKGLKTATTQSKSLVHNLVKDIAKQADGVTQSFAKMASGLSRGIAIGVTAAAGAAAYALAQLTKKSIQLAAQAEQTEVAFATMLGSATSANKLIADLREMGAKTPFGTADLLDATKTLLQFGLSASDSRKDLNALSDVAAGDANKLQSLALVFGQIASAEKLMGQDLLQLINQGFNPLQEIARRTGESMAVLKDRMSRGEITFQQVRQAFIDATSAGGRFHRMNERQSETLLGRWSTLKDVINQALLEIGESIVGNLDMTEITKGVTNMAEGFKKDLVPALQSFIKSAPDMVSALDKIAAGLIFVTEKTAKGASNIQKWTFLATTIASGMSPKEAAEAYAKEFNLMPKQTATMRGAVAIEPVRVKELQDRLRQAFPKSLEAIETKAKAPLLQAEKDAFREMSSIIDNAITKAQSFNKELGAKMTDPALADRAKDVLESIKTPQDRFNEELKQLEEIKHLIGDDNFNKAVENLHEQFAEPFVADFRIQGLDAVEAGSADAIARMMEFQNVAAQTPPDIKGDLAMIASKPALIANPIQPLDSKQSQGSEKHLEEIVKYTKQTAINTKDKMQLKPANFTN